LLVSRADSPREAADIVRLASEGAKCEDIAKRLGIGVASVYRVLAAEKAETTISNNI